MRCCTLPVMLCLMKLWQQNSKILSMPSPHPLAHGGGQGHAKLHDRGIPTSLAGGRRARGTYKGRFLLRTTDSLVHQ